MSADRYETKIVPYEYSSHHEFALDRKPRFELSTQSNENSLVGTVDELRR